MLETENKQKKNIFTSEDMEITSKPLIAYSPIDAALMTPTAPNGKNPPCSELKKLWESP